MTEQADADAGVTYLVVVNDDGQHSVWPAGADLPSGWRAEGTSGSRPDCLAHIGRVWTGMQLGGRAEQQDAHPGAPATDDGPGLVDLLTAGDTDVEVSLRPAATAEAFADALDRRYVLVRFLETRGTSELGVTLDEPVRSAAGDAVDIVGTLTLDFEPVRCVARVDPATFRGRGRLERIGP